MFLSYYASASSLSSISCKSSNSPNTWAAPAARALLPGLELLLVLTLAFLVMPTPSPTAAWVLSSSLCRPEAPRLSPSADEIIYPLAVIPLIGLGILTPVVSTYNFWASESPVGPLTRKLIGFFFGLPLSIFLRLTCLMLGFRRPGDAKLPISTLFSFPSRFYGPMACMNAPNVKVAIIKENATVMQMVCPNFLKNKISVIKRILPLPNVVTKPLRILTPICL